MLIEIAKFAVTNFTVDISGEPTYISTFGNGQFNQAWYITEDRQQFVFQVESCHGAMLAFLTYSVCSRMTKQCHALKQAVLIFHNRTQC